jgi:hypothetical protein
MALPLLRLCAVSPLRLVPLTLLLACDLPELKEGRISDAGDVDAPPPSTPDASDPVSPADARPVDGAPIDPNIPPGATIGSCNPDAWQIAASGSDASNPARYAVDGLLPTRWSSGVAQSPGQSFDIDFGGYVLLSQVVLTHRYEADGAGDYPRGIDVLVSADGADFSTLLASATPSNGDAPVAMDFQAHAARHVRLQLSAGDSTSWWSIHDLRLGCATPTGGGPDAGAAPDAGPDPTLPDTGVNPNRARWTATASHSDGGAPVGNAFDDSVGTRWATGKAPQYGDEWFRLDLGMAIEIRQVWLTTSAADFPSAYRVELSTDDVTYTTVAHGLGADVTRIGFAPQSARYVRISQTGSGYDHWWVINDLTVIQ